MSARRRSTLLGLVLDEVGPWTAPQCRHALDPGLVELVAVVLVDELLARHAVVVGKPHQLALEADEPPVDGVELLDQALDTVVVERQALDVGDDLAADLLVGLLLLARALLSRDLLLELLVLLAAQLLVVGGDLVEGLEHLGLQLGLHRRERQRVLELVLVVHVACGRGRRPRMRPPASAAAADCCLAASGVGGTCGGRRMHDAAAESLASGPS